MQINVPEIVWNWDSSKPYAPDEVPVKTHIYKRYCINLPGGAHTFLWVLS